jgi:hypothetical protein
MKLRTVAFLLGAGLVGLVVFTFGPATKGDPGSVAVFGLVCCLASSIAVPVLSYGIGLGQGGLVSRLARVPEIADLIARGDAAAGRVESLTQQREQLEQVINNEVRRGILLERRRALGTQASELLTTFDDIDTQLSALDLEADPVVKAAIEGVRARLDAKRRGDIIVSLLGTDLVVSADVLGALPLGNLLRVYLEFVSRLLRRG